MVVLGDDDGCTRSSLLIRLCISLQMGIVVIILLLKALCDNHHNSLDMPPSPRVTILILSPAVQAQAGHLGVTM